MTWQRMKQTEPQLGALEAEARAAGDRNEHWIDTWSSIRGRLNQLAGLGSGGAFPNARHFETARKALMLAWAVRDNSPNMPPWEIAEEADQKHIHGQTDA